MKVLIWHGYLLGGTGSNVYTRALARAWSRLGHDRSDWGASQRCWLIGCKRLGHTIRNSPPTPPFRVWSGTLNM